ncbi:MULTISPECIES: FAD-dependent oxidoreductase [unclassified Moorena]|uniref:FAD-dependent oxidoreductase n=1 Tax=unclassified Moorena TaxID=2683338 RepID=UPI00140076A3|nr:MULTISPECIES: FAD-dependent oxidoreductase [unclassified Moorena]NEO12845.1 FAD-binding oxidoreductase [Moorena sp. SIO3E8]NEQ01641.1 FAD-binding oxidoreductase [Moorena sp. SIO3F7]
MLETVFNLPLQQRQNIAIIGAGAMGVSTACILARLGIAKVSVFEAESKIFNKNGASLNNTGILHHFVYGAHKKTLEHLFKQSILFKKLMPEYVFVDSHVNYLVPNEIGNTAINQEGITYKDVAASLVEIYQQHLKNYHNETIFGKPEDLVKILAQEAIKPLLGNFDAGKQDIAGAVKVRQFVLNIAEYVCHMINLFNFIVRENFVDIHYNNEVSNIAINSQNFELKINHNNQLYFDTIVNAGYAKGLGIPIPELKFEQYIEGNLVKLKVYGLYKIPSDLKKQFPEIDKSFSSTMLIRGQYGGIIKVGYDHLAIFSGREYNQAELDLPLAETPKNIPKEWLDNLEKITGRTEAEMLSTIKQDISRWIPWAKGLENIKLKKAVQVYPARKTTDEVDAAKRDDNPIRYLYHHKNGGKYIHIPGFKLTSIPYNAFQVILEILSTYVCQGILTQEQVDKHIAIDQNQHIILSPEMESALGKNLSQLRVSEREKIIDEWGIY